MRRLSGASRGETNGFFIIGVQGVYISTRHLDRSGSKFSGYSWTSCGFSTECDLEGEGPFDDMVEEDDTAADFGSNKV